VETVFSWV